MADKDDLSDAVKKGDKESPNYRQRRRTNKNLEESDVTEADDKFTNMDLVDDIKKATRRDKLKKMYDNPRSAP